MTVANDPVDDNDLQAFVDGRLPGERLEAVTAYLDRNPSEAVRIAAYAAQRDQVRTYLQPKFDEPAPSRLQPAYVRARMRDRLARRVASIAVMAAVAVFSVTAGWLAYPYVLGTKVDGLVAEAVSARDGAIHPQQQFAAASIAAPEERDRLVAETLSLPVKVPDLAKAGYRLANISVYSDKANAPALQLSYRDPRGRLFTVYLRRAAGPDRFDLESRGAIQVCIWQNEDLSAVMLGEMPAKEMLKVATLTYADLNF